MVDVGDSTETFCVQLFGLMNKTNLNIEVHVYVLRPLSHH